MKQFVLSGRMAFAVAIFLTLTNIAGAQPSQHEREWQSDWIGIDQASTPNQWICFRKSIQLDSVPRRAVAHIACDSKYWLWINGEMVVREGQLKRGPTPSSTYYDDVDLAGKLKQGENSIAILVWHFGKDGFSHNSSGQAGLIFDCKVESQQLGSDETWRAMEHPAYTDTNKPHPNYRLPESNIRFDAREQLTDSNGQTWFQPGFDDSQWALTKAYGRPPTEPWGQLHRRPIPLWRDFGLKHYQNHQALNLPRVSDGELIRAKLPYNSQVNPLLTVRSASGKTIDIRMDNYRGGGTENVRAEYVTREGEQTYENLGWMNGHEVHYLIPDGVEIIDLKYRETGFDTDFAGHFHCDDEFLNRLQQKSARTLYITMRDTYLDCPDRERAQWWGDVVLEMNQSFYTLDVRSHSLARKGILELMAWQRDDGSIFSPVPAGNYDSELPTQMLASVGEYGFWTYALYTGDVETIEKVYPRVNRYLALWKLDEDGLVIPRKGGWTWGDWGENKDMPLLFNCWYYLAIEGQSNMAKMLGRTEEAALLEEQLVSLKAAFNKTFWTGSEYRSPDYKGLTDDRGHALAVVSGIAESDKFEAIAAVFRQQFHGSPYMEKYVLEALYEMQRPEQALARMKKRYRKMVAADTTTLWEGWGVGAEGYGGGTINHAWSGGAMSQYIAGIRPTEPGFETFEVRPQLGTLNQIQVVVQTVAGELTVDVSNSEKQLRLRMTSPDGTIGRVLIPAAGINTVTESGNVVWARNKQDSITKQLHNAIKFVKQDSGVIEFEVASGSYEFNAKK